ncbi:MAG: sensor histidine kinase [Mucilaginibacter sp.]|nr:sensor histidine kinase [Mucilaginibacter sp.]
MKASKNVYRKNFLLIISFLVLVSVTLVIALIVAYDLTSKNVESEFSSKKDDVLKATVSPYDNFFHNKIPEITYYNGMLDSASARKYVDSVFHDYSFVKRAVFYEILIGAPKADGGAKNKLGITPKAIYHYRPSHNKIIASKPYNAIDIDDFKHMADKLNDYIASYDTTRGPVQADVFRTFYDIKPGKISFLSIPRREDLKAYHELLKSRSLSLYPQQNMLTFSLDPYALTIKNTHPELYQNVTIVQIDYDPLDIDHTKIITDEVELPGAFLDYKLYFSSPRNYLTAETNRRFMPVGGIVLLIYACLVVIGWLIYRNLNVNLKLFKLQYDFINNFTHEFKTPVSVIKIAGSNLKGDGELTERQRKHYGKILDEEADKLNELMNKLLSFTQLENKSINIKKDKINVEAFVKGYIDTFKIKYPDFNLSYHIKDIDFFYTDPVLLGSIFQNLIENAYKYSHPSHKELFIDITHEKRNILFSFRDRGIGIPKNELNNIFKKFYRLENQYNQNGSVGLGLAFCKELANFMDGDITVQSRVDQGSEFRVMLPYEN